MLPPKVQRTGNKRLSQSRLLPFLFIGTGTGASLRRDIPLGSEDRSETAVPSRPSSPRRTAHWPRLHCYAGRRPSELAHADFLTVCFASPKNRLYSAQPPLGRSLDAGRLDGRRWTFGRETMNKSARCSVVPAYSSVSRPVKAEMHAVRGLDRPGKD